MRGIRGSALAALLAPSIVALGPPEPAWAQSICATQKNAEACRKRFASPDGTHPDAVIVGTIANDKWRFDHRLAVVGSGAKPAACSHPGDLVLTEGSHVELWLIADRGVHRWQVPTLGIDETALAGSYAPVRVDTSRTGTFGASPDAKKRNPPSIRIVEAGSFGSWARRTMGRACAASLSR